MPDWGRGGGRGQANDVLLSDGGAPEVATSASTGPVVRLFGDRASFARPSRTTMASRSERA
jgi:hypothetical protein